MSVRHRLLACLSCAALLGVPTLALAQGAGGVRAAQPPDTVPRGSLDGVIEDSFGDPLEGASVFVEGRPGYDMTDRRGRFALRGIPAGPVRVVARRLMHKPIVFEVDLPADATVHVRIRLEPTYVNLGAIMIDGQAHSLHLVKAGFYDRSAKQATGYFYPPEEILRRRLSSLASLLAEVPGLSFGGGGPTNMRVPFGRPTGGGACQLNVWIDGALASAGPADLDALVPGPIVRAVEVYPSATAVPDRFVRPGNKCGAILVWTKGVVRDYF